jgi:aryl-alcohol dehydrogenase-like predicted oxidoreductase
LKPENIEKAARLQKIAESIELSLSQLALAWVLRRDEISCTITGATRVEQLLENVAASGIKLDAETIARIETATSGETIQ